MTELCTADNKVGVLQLHVSEVVDVALAVLQYTVDTEVKVALSAAVAGHVLRLAKIVHTTQAIVLSDEFDPRPTLAERTAAPLILRASLTCFQRARVQGGSECLIEVATRLEPARAAQVVLAPAAVVEIFIVFEVFCTALVTVDTRIVVRQASLEAQIMPLVT